MSTTRFLVYKTVDVKTVRMWKNLSTKREIDAENLGPVVITLEKRSAVTWLPPYSNRMRPPSSRNPERNCDPAKIPKGSFPFGKSRLRTTSSTSMTGPLAPWASLQRWRSTSFQPEESLRERISESFVSSLTAMWIVERFGADSIRGK